MKEFVLRRVNVSSVFKVTFLLYALVGVVIAFFYIFLLVIAWGTGSRLMGPEMARFLRFGVGLTFVLGIFGVGFFGLFYAAISALITAAMAGLYNVAVGWTGGIRISLDPEMIAPALPAPPPPAPPAPDAATPPVPAQPWERYMPPAARPREVDRVAGMPKPDQAPDEKPDDPAPPPPSPRS